MGNNLSLILLLGIKIIIKLKMSPIMNGIPSIIVKPACNLYEINIVIMKHPERETRPVYLNKEIAVSTIAFESM